MTTTAAPIAARRAGFARDVMTVAGRGLRSIPRDLESVIPALVIPVFFFFVNVGALQPLAEAGNDPDFDFRAFQIPTAILFGVTGVTRAPMLVLDIQSGYFDRLLMTPVRRGALLLGLMASDFVLALALTVPVLVLGLIVGVSYAGGALGWVVILLIAAGWSLAYAGFPYAIALKTGNPAAVNTAFLIFFPFVFLTTAFVPKENLTGWLSTVADFNPVTYVLEGMRSVILVGWVVEDLAWAALAIGGVMVVTLTMSFLALRGRVSRGA
ncbi:MAG: ABC transporter permease [Miltoncostaeaceae bacterium]